MPKPIDPITMPKVKLFLHKASAAPIVVILRRDSTSKDNWEMIEWNLETDTFTEGQWLMSKHMNGAHGHLSPDGKYFAYHYELYGYSNANPEGGFGGSIGVVSAVPNFTALLCNPNHCGCWQEIQFSPKGEVVFNPENLETRGEHTLKVIRWSKDLILDANSYLETLPWTDPKGRLITVDEGKILADGTVLYDTTDHKFVARSPLIR